MAELDRHLSPLRDHLLAWQHGAGIPVFDLTGPLQAAAREGRIPFFWGDSHLNATGHDAAARALARWQAVGGAVGDDDAAARDGAVPPGRGTAPGT